MISPITANPIPETIPLSSLGIGFEAIAQIPSSSFNNSPPRLNFLQSPKDDSGRLFVNDMLGKLYSLNQGIVTEYLDLKSIIGPDFLAARGQQGFIGFTFDPDFKNNGIFYTVHSESKGDKMPDFPVTKPIINSQGNIIASSHHDVISQWIVQDPSANSFSGIHREILRIEQPYRDHNLGEIAFNPNALPGSADYGLLYIASADGGSDGFPVSNTDPLDNGQDLSVPLGKILRIDPQGRNSANGQYGIPIDNPFVDDNDPNTLGEIWAYGLRNPHRFSWDTGGEGKLLIVDIGQSFIEEVNLGIKGANYGWGNREGTFLIDENNEFELFPLPEDDAINHYTYPVAQYDHDLPTLVAIAGGFVYRGLAIPELNGQYIFADFATDGRFFTVNVDHLINGQQASLEELIIFNDDGEQTTFLELLDQPRSDLRFGTDEGGEIYVINKRDGIVRRIIAGIPATDDIFYGSYLSETFDGKGGFDQVIYHDLNVTVTLTATNQVIKQGASWRNRGTWVDQLISIEQVEANPTRINTIDASDADYRRIEVDLETNQFSIFEAESLAQTVTVVNFRNVIGTDQADIIKGNSLNNRLEGGKGNDIIDGSLGNNTLIGGEGDDIYYVNKWGNKMIEKENEGTDIVKSSISYTLPDYVENLELLGSGNLRGTGNSLNNLIIGNSGNNLLDGKAGEDILIGGQGNDTLNLGLNDGVSDIVQYAAGDGRDTVNHFVKGIDKLAFIDIPFVDVIVAGSNTLLRLGNGIKGDAGFGRGQVLVNLRGVTGFTDAHLGINGSSINNTNMAQFFFA